MLNIIIRFRFIRSHSHLILKLTIDSRINESKILCNLWDSIRAQNNSATGALHTSHIMFTLAPVNQHSYAPPISDKVTRSACWEFLVATLNLYMRAIIWRLAYYSHPACCLFKIPPAPPLFPFLLLSCSKSVKHLINISNSN